MELVLTLVGIVIGYFIGLGLIAVVKKTFKAIRRK